MTEFHTDWRKMNRRTFITGSGKWLMSLIAAGLMTGTYSYRIERFWYEIKEIHLKLKKLPPGFKGWKIVQFSDVHLGFHYGVEELEHVIKMINSLNPDIIFFTGDLVQMGYTEPEVAIPLLKELKAYRGGKWAVIGNHDFYTKKHVTSVLESADFKVLNNKHGFIEHNQQRLFIVGIDDVMYGMPSIRKAVSGLADHECALLLAHEPDIADDASNYLISAQFSGHSHGGQVRLPFYGPIIKQDLAENYTDGFYLVGKDKMPLYVNRGIGTTKLAIRFFCRPEITLFHLT